MPNDSTAPAPTGATRHLRFLLRELDQCRPANWQMLSDAEAELDELEKNDTETRLQGMLAAFEAAHTHASERAIVDDDPAPALANVRAWRWAADAVAKLLGGGADS